MNNNNNAVKNKSKKTHEQHSCFPDDEQTQRSPPVLFAYANKGGVQ